MDDITSHLEEDFPELTKATVRRLVSGSLREIAKRAATGRPVKINGSMISSGNKGLDFYALYMPAPPEAMYGKIYKYDNGRSKRKK